MPRRVVVVGAGAAGLTAALRAAEAGARVTLFNAHPRIGLKILMSGGTRCNVTHREVTARDFHGGSRNVVARILRAFPPEATREWFESLGVRLVLEDTGKYFPESDDAQTVLDALLGACQRAGVEVRSGARVVRLERVEAGAAAGAAQAAGASGAAEVADASGAAKAAGASGAAAEPGWWRFGVQSVGASAAFSAAAHAVGGVEWPLPAVEPDFWLEADTIVLATGGLSFPRTGSDGTGYALAAALGHTIVPPVPALTPLASEDALCREAQGVTAEAALTLWADGRKVEQAAGSLLVTHFGYSGPAALDLSRHWHRAEGAARRVTARWVPHADAERLARDWLDEVLGAHLSVRAWLHQRLPDRLGVLFAREAGIEPATLKDQVPREKRDALFALLLARDLRVTGTLGYEKAEVTAGGVALDEVDASTLESRKAPGLFLCGEILDVEGRLGGFNFQWAWSSGTVAGRAAAETPGT